MAQIFSTSLSQMTYDPYAAWLLARARKRALNSEGKAARVVRGVPKSWR